MSVHITSYICVYDYIIHKIIRRSVKYDPYCSCQSQQAGQQAATSWAVTVSVIVVLLLVVAGSACIYKYFKTQPSSVQEEEVQ